MFKEVDVVVCNYLFSENKNKLGDAAQAIARLSQLVRNGCTFVVIDRLETNPNFVKSVAGVFEPVFGQVDVNRVAGLMDLDEDKSVFGNELLERLGNPRIQFRTPFGGQPTVFWFAVQK